MILVPRLNYFHVFGNVFSSAVASGEGVFDAVVFTEMLIGMAE